MSSKSDLPPLVVPPFMLVQVDKIE